MTIVLPQFDTINLENAETTLDHILANNLKHINALLDKISDPTWEDVMDPVNAWQDALHQFWGPIQHLSAVMDTPTLRTLMHRCLPKLSDYHTTLAHHQKLYQAIKKISEKKVFHNLSVAQQKTIALELRDFHLNGVSLSPEKKKEFSELSKALSKDSHHFEENVLDATMAFKKHLKDESELSGIPKIAKNSAKTAAMKEGLTGYLFTLDMPSYLAIMTHADSRSLRETFYTAFVTRASDQGSQAGKSDNTQVMHTILKNRLAIAKLLGFSNYAEYSLATKMIKTPREVLNFLNELAEKARPQALEEWKTLCAFAKQKLAIQEMQAWDVAYVSEKLRQTDYDISQETLRPYFSIDNVLPGLFEIIARLYNVSAQKVTVSTWHPDVCCYQLQNTDGDCIAHIYFDLYARPNKRGGAWMDDCMIRRRLSNQHIQLPAAYVNCNFNGPNEKTPALLTHDDVVTLFHECGHALQHVLTKIEVDNVSGIRNVPWDAVEIASQFFENWAWDKTAVAYFAKHYETQSPLPEDLFSRMHRAKNFLAGMQMMRQLEFAIFDFQLHLNFDEQDPNCVQKTLDTVRQKLSVYLPPSFNRFQHSFTHIFGGGYAAGYYSYKWAEMMACDAFSRFKEAGIFDKKASDDFKKTFLESGGSVDPIDLFIAFRGRQPSVDAMLRQNGIHTL